LSPEVSDHLLGGIRRRGQEWTPETSVLEVLAPRELQVFRLVAAGNASKDIAAILDLGLETIRSYRKTRMKKLGVNNVAGVTQIAVATGVAPSDVL
jgi:DNA-binding CsgD family transcriptional regulator